MCSSGISFDPVVLGERYTFDVAGIYNGVFAMKDRNSGSLWTHFDGTVIQGSLAGTGLKLETVPTVHLRWSDWIAEYPNSTVLDWYPDFTSRYDRTVEPGGGQLRGQFANSLLNTDDRLEQNELVLGAVTDSGASAYVLHEFTELTAINDIIGGAPLVVMLDPADVFGLAYSAVVDGVTLEFSAVNGVIVDENGSTWNRTGLATSGPQVGTQLDYVTSFVTEWYGWAAYNPGTSIYGR